MVAELRVGTLRLPDRRLDADAMLRRLDLARGADRRVLIVRRLAVEADEPGEAARSRLEDLRRHAARPALGPVDPHAGAVEFADEAEALRCLSEDLARGVASSRWWWQGTIPNGDTGEALTTAWTREPRWVPPALGPLVRERPHAAAAMASLLTPEQIVRVIAAVTAAYSEPPADEMTRGSFRADAPTIPESPSPTAPTLATPSPAAALLLGLVRLLDERPAAVRTAAAQTWLSDVARLGADESSRSLLASEGPAEVAHTLSVLTEPASSALVTRARRGAENRPEHGDDVVTPLDLRRPPPTPGQPDQSWRHAPWAGSGPSMHSEMATMLYAVNLMRRLGLDHLAAAKAGAATGWAVVEAVGRWLLRSVPMPRRRTLLADPLLQLLADLDGRTADLRTPVRLGSGVRPVRQFLTEHDIEVDTFTLPGQVLVSRTHVDVVLRLDQIDLAARSAGLDQDPGWVPDLGRVVLFHFEEVS